MKLLLFCLLVELTVAEISKDEGVLVLTEENFQGAVEGNEFLLVEFYAPWCGHCKALAPEYAKAAQILAEKDSPILLGKVDATEETNLAKMFAVQGYPTVKFVKHGKYLDYSGGRVAEDIVAWVERKSGPAAETLANVEDAKTFIESNGAAIIGFYKDLESADAKAFLSAAENLSEFPFAIISEASAFEEYKQDESGMVLFKNFDEGRNNFEGEVTDDAVVNFISRNAVPLVIEFNQQSTHNIFNREVTSDLFLFLSASDEEYSSKIEIARGVAKDYKGEMLFIAINTDEENHREVMELFEVEPELPSMRIINTSDMSKFIPDSIELSEENIRDFVKKYLAGELKPHLKSQDVPEDWDKEPVKVLVGKNFKEVVMNVEKDVLVEFYAPWCGHCKQLFPIWHELGEKFKDSDNVVIAKIDLTANELEEVKVDGFPTIKLFRKEDNKVINYDGERSLDGFIKFINNSLDEEAAAKWNEDEEDDVLGHDEL